MSKAIDPKHIYIYTQAYNAEKTIERTIQSVLSQTYPYFTYHIFDNGSSDYTFELIKKYAASDARIVPEHRSINDFCLFFNMIPEEIKKDTNCSFFCNLDADDEYLPTFLEKMLDFMQSNSLEAATCGTDWIDRESGKCLKHKIISKSTVLEGQQFTALFPYYHHFITTVWGGLYSAEVIRKCSWKWVTPQSPYSQDNAACLEIFSHCQRAGILAESLHKYYISHNSITFQYDPKRFESCKQLYRVGEQYLAQYGPISAVNQNYLYVVYFIMLQGAVDNLLAASIGFSEKLKNLEEIFQCELTVYLLKNWDAVGIYTKKNEFLSKIEEWLCTQQEAAQYQDKIEDFLKTYKNGR